MASELQAQQFVHDLEHGKGRWWVWFLVIVLVAIYQVVTFLFINPLNFQGGRQETFRGLTHAKGMEQAIIARELSRGNGFTTTMVKPASIQLMEKNLGEDSFKALVQAGRIPDFYHAPLNPFINSIALRASVAVNDKLKFRTDEDGKPDYWQVKKNEMFPSADRVIAGVSVFFFLAGVAMTYLLARILFDERLAVLGVLVTLSCDHFWDYAMTGLPQMLMLFLFSLGMLLYARALMAREAGGARMWLWLGGTGVCFGLLALAHPISFFILIGLLIHAGFAFRPYGAAPGVLLAVALVFFVPWMVRNKAVCGSVMGLGWETRNFQIRGSESQIMRKTLKQEETIEVSNYRSKIQGGIVAQFDKMGEHFGKILLVPFFFLAILHGFRKRETNSIKGALFLMWFFAFFGMAFMGMGDYDLLAKNQSNDLHLIFIPLMACYGFALVLMFWGRVTIQDREICRIPIFNTTFQVLIVTLGALPLLGRYTDPPRIGFVWPPYVPRYIAQLGDWYGERDVICTDMPWAVWWYADRRTLWLPITIADFNHLNDFKFDGRITGLLFTPVTGYRGLLSEISTEFREWSGFIKRDPRAGSNFPLKAAHGFFGSSIAEYLIFADRDRWTERNN